MHHAGEVIYDEDPCGFPICSFKVFTSVPACLDSMVAFDAECQLGETFHQTLPVVFVMFLLGGTHNAVVSHQSQSEMGGMVRMDGCASD